MANFTISLTSKCITEILEKLFTILTANFLTLITKNEIIKHYRNDNTYNWTMTCALFCDISMNPDENNELKSKELQNLLGRE